MASAAAAAGPSAASSTDSDFTIILKEQAARRQAHKQVQERRIHQAITIAEEIENNCRACLGLELQSVQHNNKQLEESIKKLTKFTVQTGKDTVQSFKDLEALQDQVAEVGNMATWLKQSEAVLGTVASNLAFIERSLSSE